MKSAKGSAALKNVDRGFAETYCLVVFLRLCKHGFYLDVLLSIFRGLLCIKSFIYCLLQSASAAESHFSSARTLLDAIHRQFHSLTTFYCKSNILFGYLKRGKAQSVSNNSRDCVWTAAPAIYTVEFRFMHVLGILWLFDCILRLSETAGCRLYQWLQPVTHSLAEFDTSAAWMACTRKTRYRWISAFTCVSAYPSDKGFPVFITPCRATA